MNESAKELLSIIKDYIESLEYKNEQGMMGDVHIEIIQKGVDSLGSLDNAIMAGKVKADRIEPLSPLTDEEHNKGLNQCDKCGMKCPSEDLVWITAEDFEPREGEVVPDSLYSKYDALCEDCYQSEINKVEVEASDIESSVFALYEASLNEYAVANIEAGINEDGFTKSKQFENFKENVLSILTLGLKKGTIQSNEVDKILGDYDIVATESELNKLVADDPPMPSEVPPVGKQWVKQKNESTGAMEWVLINKV